jgi:diguanylate cyclase (GGDEF)-like protein/PAS domain S-box-containing protein
VAREAGEFMQPIWARAVRVGRDGMEPLLVLAVIAGLREFGLSGDGPLWIIAVVLVIGAVSQQPAVQRRLAGGDLQRRVWPRVGLHVLQATATMYLTGWGSLLAVAHLHILSVHLKQSGSRSWRPAAVASVAGIAIGQILFAAGVLHSYLDVTRTNGVALLIGLGVVTTARVLGQTVRQREVVQDALRRSEERLGALVRDGSEVIVEARADGSVTYVSPASLPVMGFRPEQLHGQGLNDLVHPDDHTKNVELHARVLASDAATEHTVEIRLRHADGAWHWHEMTVRNMLSHPEVRALIGHHRDITERRTIQDRIAYAAARDGLTGLANSPTMARDLERALALGTRYQHPVGMLFLDLDGFKRVNDTFGHDVGDRLLTAISDVIRRTVRDTDSVGRLGGDEFGVVLSRVAGAEEALAVAGRIISGIEGSSSVAGLRLDVGCSIGVAIASPGGSDAKTMLRHADAAMYRSKRRGRNGAQLYVEEEIVAPWLG